MIAYVIVKFPQSCSRRRTVRRIGVQVIENVVEQVMVIFKNIFKKISLIPDLFISFSSWPVSLINLLYSLVKLFRLKEERIDETSKGGFPIDNRGRLSTHPAKFSFSRGKQLNL